MSGVWDLGKLWGVPRKFEAIGPVYMRLKIVKIVVLGGSSNSLVQTL